MKNLTRLAVMAAAVLALSVCAGTASADGFTVNFWGPGIDGTLNVDAVQTSPGIFAIDAISGSVDGLAVTGLVPVTNPSGYSTYVLPDGDGWLYNNLLYPNFNPAVDYYGILFTLAGVADPVNLFSNPGGIFGVYIGGGNYPNDFVQYNVQVAVARTPEPSTFALGLAGIAMFLAAVAWKKFRGGALLSAQNS